MNHYDPACVPVNARSEAVSQCSIGPAGERFPLPTADNYEEERRRLATPVGVQRRKGREIVVVMGVGFVGAVMAGVVADSVNRRTGKPGKFVLAMQRPSSRSYWKIPYLQQGKPPVQSEDPEVEQIIRRCVLEKKTLSATFSYDALELADAVVVDVQCDYVKDKLGDMRVGRADIAALEESFKIIGDRIRPDCLVLIETTVPPGTTERIAYPVLKQAFAARDLSLDPLVAHSYERVMPGRHYVASVRDFWRVCSGVGDAAQARVVAFLSEVLNVEQYPLTVLDRPIESETCKIVENSYRATILAFMDEWSRFAEKHGVDIGKVIQAIKVRPTHSNIMFPGPGIGGYCLPKDGALGQWGVRHLLGDEESAFPITTAAINVNDARGVHAAELTCDALTAMGRPVAGSTVLICGASYREDVGDTRYSGSELVARRMAELGAAIRVHDPYVDHWHELENQETYPAAGQSRSRFFRNQERMTDIRIQDDLATVLRGVAAIVLAVRHKQYLDLDPEWVVERVGGPVAVVDCFAMLSDGTIRRYLDLGCEVKGLGRGHIARIKAR
ncbi:MAG: nucleotide sugar dehydrogenase [Zetaproteobacteria bacterium]|nr:MAG: nucleotide sugar dehydrogenase [Zetaproteobacteria bacterium]